MGVSRLEFKVKVYTNGIHTETIWLINRSACKAEVKRLKREGQVGVIVTEKKTK